MRSAVECATPAPEAIRRPVRGLVVGRVVGIVDRDHLVRQRDHLLGIGRRHAEDVQEDGDRQRLGDVEHPVELPLRNGGIQQARGRRAGKGLVRVDGLRGEEGGDDAAQVLMQRRVRVDQAAALLERLGLDLLQHRQAFARREDLRVLRDRDDVLMLRDRPEAVVRCGLGVPMHGILVAQQRELIVQHALLPPLGRDQIDAAEVFGGGGHGVKPKRRRPRPEPGRAGSGRGRVRTR